MTTLVVLGGSIISHSMLWYRIGRIEKTINNGGKD